jgi:predicted RNA-binding protein with TRAM domain
VGALLPTTAQNVTTTPSDRKIVVSWSPPAHQGSSAITGYQVRRLSDNATARLGADERSFTWTELTNGQSYAFEVTAVSAAGAGNPVRTAPVTPTFDSRLPTEPTNTQMMVDTGARTAELTWSPPASSGASSVTGYRVTRSGTDSTGAGPISTLLPASARSYTFSNLKAGSDYDVTLRAVNSVGDGRAYETAISISTQTASAPVEVTATPGDHSAFVSWKRPLDLGYSWPTQYRVRRYVGSSTTPQATTTVDGETYSLAVSGLTPGTAYTFDVTAINDAGAGEPSARTSPVTPTTVATAPSKPTSVTAGQASASTATLNWQPPVSDGGSAITGYRVARDGRDSGGGGPWSTTVPATTRTFTFTLLSPWDTYTFTVQAINAAGTGPAVGRAVTITASTPSAPTTVKVAPGNASATVTWRPPLHPSSPAVTGYRIRRYAATGSTVQATSTVAASARSFTATGLTNGTGYRFDVTAINSSGTGRASAISPVVTPVTVPGAPTIGTATAGTSGGTITATAAWSAPSSTGGSAITGYRVTALRVNSAGDVLSSTVSAVQPASARSLSMTLPQTGNYQFTVQAVNAVGTGAASGRSNVVAGR